MRKGFTLVELSIVLVIIGLLIGGVLAGQTMVAATKINTQIKQIQQLDIAVNNFVTQYKALPGDSAVLGCNTGKCEDGQVQDSLNNSSGGVGTWYFSEEVSQFWPQLSISGLTKNGISYSPNLPATGFNTIASTPNSPVPVIGNNGGIIVGTTGNNFGMGLLTVYEFADWRGVKNSDPSIQVNGANTFTPMQMYAIEKKIDDGYPYSGNVMPVATANPSLYWFGWPGNCEVSGVYKTTNVPECGLMVKVLSQVGQKVEN